MTQFRLPFLLASLALSASLFAGEADDVADLLRKQRPDDALQTADRALAKSPRDARLRLLRGNALVALGRVPEAIQVFTALTADYPSLPEPYNNLAALYAQQGQLDKARAALQMALQTNRSYATAQANLADVYARLAAQAYDKALQRDVVERQNGQTAPVVAGSTPPKLALMPDLVTSPTAPAGNMAAIKPTPTPVVVASATPAPAPTPARPVENKPAPQSLPVAKPTPTPAPTPTVLAAVTVKPTPAPVAQPAKPAEKPQSTGKDSEEQIGKALQGWAEAWSAKKVSAYLSYYSRSFKPGNMSRNEWEKQRRERIEAARKIDVKLSNLKIKLDGDRATVHFVQRYKSDRLDTAAGKTLILEKNGGRWLITEERVG
jgi:ketosteroid isomerase-like protein